MTKLPLCTNVLAALAAASPARAADHPFDPLSNQAAWRVLELVRDAGHMDRETHFSWLTLHEPPTRDVLAGSPGTGMPRNAYAVVRQGKDCFEATIDLAADQVAAPIERRLPASAGRLH